MGGCILELRELTYMAIGVRILAALVLGGVIGLERGMKNRPAGLRTYMLVCIGSCLIMMTNQFIFQATGTGDPTRMSAQVISGIGFLGAGTIMIRNQSVITGLTTAAGVWCTATIGIALGYGFYLGAAVATVIALITATWLTRLETGKKNLMRLYLELENPNQVTATVEAIQERYPSAKHAEISSPKSGLANTVGLSVTVILDKEEQDTCLTTLTEMDNVLFVVEE